MSSYTLRNASPARTRADAVVVGVVKAKDGPRLAPGAEEVGKAWGRRLRPLLASLGVTGKAGEATTLPTNGTLSSPLLVLVGLGPEAEVDQVAVRRAAGVAARSVPNAASVALALPADTAVLIRAVIEGHTLGGYRFTAYKRAEDGDQASGRSPADAVLLTPLARRNEARAAQRDGEVVARAVAGARDWVNTPPGDLTPPAFATSIGEAHTALAKGRGTPPITMQVLDEAELARLGCGGLLGVGGGSDAPPRLVELSYAPEEARAHLAFVGKGITFDSGGLTIKPAQSMKDMKMDMGGAAAVVQATFAIAELGLPVRVSTFAPLAENMVSGTSMRPGDVITIYGGKTVEVSNTDAEGRLVLADGLGRAVEAGPDAVVDVATLTGAMVIALGDRVTGVMGSDEVVDQVLGAAEAAGEACWPMPIPEEMSERVRSSKLADLAQHDWIRWGGGLFAGAFLREFTGGLPWAHLDIAGPGFHSGGATGHLTPGGTGVAVATLVELARARSEA